jgi:outer membrane protein assembly factor BamB
VPVYALATTLTRKARLERHNRPELDAPLRSPAWTAELGTPVWADIVAAGGALYVGADDGKLRALDAQTGAGRWTYTAAGPLRSGPTVAGDRLYVTSDDGILHCLGARDAKPVWQLRVNRMPAERLPATDPKSRYDFHGAPVTVVRNTVYAGTHEGRLLALDARDGSARWTFTAGDRILAAPFVAGDRVLVGCYDGKVYTLDAASGALRWTFDAKAPITSTPVLTQGVVVVGSRGYDLWGLDVATGRPRWNRYIWFSWIESTVVVAGRHGYVGSSDAAKLFAFDTTSGKPLWNADVHGYAWGTPLLDGGRIYIGTRGEAARPRCRSIDPHRSGHRAHAVCRRRRRRKPRRRPRRCRSRPARRARRSRRANAAARRVRGGCVARAWPCASVWSRAHRPARDRRAAFRPTDRPLRRSRTTTTQNAACCRSTSRGRAEPRTG